MGSIQWSFLLELQDLGLYKVTNNLLFGITGSTQLWNSNNPSYWNYGINTCSRAKSLDLFWTEVQGWYNPTTFWMTKVHWIRSEPKFKDDTILPHSWWPKFTRSILNRSSRVIQSFFILDDRGHRITSGHMSWDDTIPLHSRRLRSSDHFREISKGWYNPNSISRTEVTRSL